MPLLVTALYSVVALAGAAFAAVELRLLVRFLRNRDGIRAAVTRRPASVGTEGGADLPPTVTIQLPLYNERTSAEQVVRAAAAQSYPRDRFDIQVLDDSTDETSAVVAAVVAELAAEGVRIEHIRREHRTGFKAGALAEGLERSTSDFVAIFDADFRPEPDFLASLLVEGDAFDDPTVAFVQARWSWDTRQSGLIAAALALLLDRHYWLQKPTRAYLGDVTTFNGSAGIWRRAAIDTADGWSADTITEDLDLTFRCAMQGMRGRYVRDVAVPNELPTDMRAFKLQQRRWARGNAQCFRKLSGKVIGAGDVIRDRLEEVFLLAGYGIHPIVLSNLLLWPFAVLLMNRPYFLAVQVLLITMIVVAPVSFALTVRERDGELALRAVGQVLGAMGIGLGLMVNNTLAQLQGFVSDRATFVRTPKRLAAPTSATTAALGAGEAYASPLHWPSFLAELVVVAYCAAAIWILVGAGEWLWAVALVAWGGCVALVATLQLRRS